jgi:hypothetical protein
MTDPGEQEAEQVADDARRAAEQVSGSSAADAGDGVRDVVSGPGRALEHGVAVDMGRRLGHDLSGVRIHTGARASASARALSADAYTVGNAIVFDDGRYAPGDPDGRALLVHELVHTLQQPNGPPPTLGALTVAAPGSAAESEAARLGSAALRGSLPPSRLPAVALSGGGGHAIMRAPARARQPVAELVAVQFTLTEDDFRQRDALGPDELGIRGVMTLYGVDRDEALLRISADRWAFHPMKDHPQPYTRADIGRTIRWTARLKPLAAGESEAMAQRRSALSVGERRSVYDEVDREFAHRTGSDRKLGRGEADAGGRELWRRILDERLRAGDAAATGRGTASEPGVTEAGEAGGEASPLDTAMASPRMRQYLGSSRAPGAPLSAEDTVAALEVAKGVEALSEADYQRYYANPTRQGTGTWPAALANMQRLQAARARDTQVGAALAGDAEMIALIEASRQSPYAKMTMLKDAMQAAGVEVDPDNPAKSMKEYEANLLAARGFNSLADYEEARTGPWRDAVQERALEVAHETLARAIRSARGLNHAMSDDRLATALFEQLRPLRAGGASAASSQLLRAYPFLANAKAWGYAMKATGPAELQWYLGYYVLSMLRGAEEIDERLRRHPDRVMQWDAVVQEALSEMGIAADSPQAAFIAHGIGHAPDTSFLHQLEEIGDFALYFVPGVGEAKAAGNFLDASSEYDTGRVEASLELREDPSVVPVIASLAAVALPLGGSKVLGTVAKPLTEAAGGAGKWLTKILGRGAEAIEAEAPQAARSVVPHVETQLKDLEQSMAKEKLPVDYTRVLEHLDAQPPGPAVDSFRRALPIAMEALRTPRLYGEVLDEMMARMARNGTTFEQELRAMAQESGLAWKTIKDLPSSRDFWEQYASQPVAINDLRLAKGAHGQWTHIIQDLAVDRALGDAFNRGLDVPATIGEFRKLMGSLGTDVEVMGRLEGEPPLLTTPLGDAAWRATFDLFDWANQMPQPELIAPKLKQALADFLGVKLDDVPLK